MAALMIKSIPEDLHKKLKEEARIHHRSMNRHIVAILEEKLGGLGRPGLPAPLKLRKQIKGDWVTRAIRRMRDAK